MPLTMDAFEHCEMCSSTTGQYYHPMDRHALDNAYPEFSPFASEYSERELRELILRVNEGNTTPTPPTMREIRAWANAEGFYVARTGRIATWILSEYKRVHDHEDPRTIGDWRTRRNMVNVIYRHSDDNTACLHRHFGVPCPHGGHHTPERLTTPQVVYSPDYGDLNDGSCRVRVAIDWRGHEFVEVAGYWGTYDDYSEARIDFLEIRPIPEPCHNCRSTRRDSRYEIAGETYCARCVVLCSCHGVGHLRGSDTYTLSMGDVRCIGYEHTCELCGEVCGEEYFYHPSEGVNVCPDCIPRCGVCNGILNAHERCEYCRRRNRARNVRGYASTIPTMWLGGAGAPSAKEGDYYLGFELEVSSDYDDDTDPLKNWAREHLTDRDALDLKEDSSVRGFEIVTMPMTPEFFESVDWDSFFAMLNENLSEPRVADEPDAHGLHVHISRTAFKGSEIAAAAFCYLLAGNSEHLERISRRPATHYCARVDKPVSTAIVATRNHTAQGRKLRGKRIYPGRGAISLMSHRGDSVAQTIEVRAGKSTRNPDALRAQVRLVYVAAEYVRALMTEGNGFIPPKALQWSAFAEWVQTAYPYAYPSIAGI